MKKYLPILAVFCLALTFCSTGEKAAVEADTVELVPTQFSQMGFAEVLAQAKQDNKHVIVDFFSPT